FVAVIVTGLPIYMMSGDEKIALYHRIQNGDVPRIIVIALPLKLLSGVIYATITLLFLRRHRDQIKASYSSVERINLHWLVLLSGGGAFIWLMAVTFQLLDTTG